MTADAHLHCPACALDRLREDILAGAHACSLDGCDKRSAGWIEDYLTLRPQPICTGHIPRARQLGYTVHTSMED